MSELKESLKLIENRSTRFMAMFFGAYAGIIGFIFKNTDNRFVESFLNSFIANKDYIFNLSNIFLIIAPLIILLFTVLIPIGFYVNSRDGLITNVKKLKLKELVKEKQEAMDLGVVLGSAGIFLLVIYLIIVSNLKHPEMRLVVNLINFVVMFAVLFWYLVVNNFNNLLKNKFYVNSFNDKKMIFKWLLRIFTIFWSIWTLYMGIILTFATAIFGQITFEYPIKLMQSIGLSNVTIMLILFGTVGVHISYYYFKNTSLRINMGDTHT